MGILSELKKLFFASRSVAKHSAEKTGDFVKKEADQVVESAKDKISSSKEAIAEKTAGLKESIMENSEALIEKAKDKIDDISEEPVVKKAAEISEDVGDKILTAGEKLIEKAQDISEKVGEKVLHGKDSALDKGKEVSEEVGSKIIEVKDDLVEKAKDAAEKIGDKIEETMEKADAWAEAEKLKPKKDFADEDLTTGDSLLDGKDDFFSKASQYADGDYAAFSEGKITIDKMPEDAAPVKDNTPASNFTDLDGDGNEIIDDAIIHEEAEDDDQKQLPEGDNADNTDESKE